MLGKLTKYEFKYMSRIFPLLYIVLIAMAAISRLLFYFADRYEYIDIASGFSVFALILLFMAVLSLPAIFVVVRFYKSMIGDEGYLTFTLPVKPKDILLSKLINAVAFSIFSLIAAIIAAVILLAGAADFSYIAVVIRTLINNIFSNCPIDFIILIFEVLVCALFYVVSLFCHLYVSMSVGQIAGKHKIISSIAAYFGLGMLLQAFSSTVIVLVERLWRFDIANSDINMVVSSITATLGVYSLYYVIISVLLFMLSSYLLTKKLNLE